MNSGTTRLHHDTVLFTPTDAQRFREGSHCGMHEKLGAHLCTCDGTAGAYFAVWSPSAREVSVIGDFNGWDPRAHPLRSLGDSGIWTGFIPGVARGSLYKYRLVPRSNGGPIDKADPFAICTERTPGTASVVWDLDYRWRDAGWMEARRAGLFAEAPVSIYEMHLGSWRRVPEEGDRALTYRETAPLLANHARDMGFTHVELLPVMEHPFYGSWGYQTTGYFAPTSRYGTPQELMELIDGLHGEGIGVILDWVPAHFPDDPHGLALFDGAPLYEHADPRKGFHPDWHSAIFDYERGEVRSFLLSSAMFWLERYHADGLRVDGVASMLYLDYSRKPGEWVPNRHGGRENLEAIDLIRGLNDAVRKEHPSVFTVAEESTAWPMVSRPTGSGGLGFSAKWDMGWMHDTLRYMSRPYEVRKQHHWDLTFRMVYAFNENYILPLSHDEVGRGEGSLIGRMPGNEWEKRANLRLLLGYMYGQPGKKLLFMGGEFGQLRDWSHDRSLDWHLVHQFEHAGIQRWVRDLNQAYRREPALHAMDFRPEGFEWIEPNDTGQSVLTFLRKGPRQEDIVLVACNFSPVARRAYRVGVPLRGFWRELLNSDAPEYGGSGAGNGGGVEAEGVPFHGRPFSVSLEIPPLATVILRCEGARS